MTVGRDKKGRQAMLVTSKFLQTGTGKEFFDTLHGLSPEQRATLESLETEGLLDLKELSQHEPLANALRQDSTFGLFWAMVRSQPVHLALLIFRHFGWAIIVLGGFGLLMANIRVAGALLLGIGLLLMLWNKRTAKKRPSS